MPRVWADWDTGSRNRIGKYSHGLFFQLSEFLQTINRNWPELYFHLMYKNKTHFENGWWGITPLLGSTSCCTLKSYALTELYSVSDVIALTRLRFLDTQMSCPVGVSTSLVIVLASSNRQHVEKPVDLFCSGLVWLWFFVFFLNLKYYSSGCSLLVNTTEVRQFYIINRESSPYWIKRLQKIDLVKMLLADYHKAVYKTI